MTRHFSIGHRLPRLVAVPLFGDRDRFGRITRPDDPDWRAWVDLRRRFYHDTQRTGVGKIVNDAGYRVLRRVDASGARILEIGPGSLPHLPYLRGRPASYAVVDINPDMAALAADRLAALGIPTETYREMPSGIAPFDTIVSFYSLEHLHPLDAHLDQMKRLLKPGGVIVGAIPTEGGLAWGLGRLLTSRRYIKRHSTANPDKILCWEHPNFAEAVLDGLDRHFRRVHLDCWPLVAPLLDINLVARFVYARP